MTTIRQKNFGSEWVIKTSRSGGKGGQNVNKVETKVELLFNVAESRLLDDEQKMLIQQKLANRINNEGFLQLTAEEARSQLQNKEIVIQKFYDLLEFALKKPKPRKKTKPTKASKEARLKSKKINAGKKAGRREKFN